MLTWDGERAAPAYCIRATAPLRLHAALVLLCRALQQAADTGSRPQLRPRSSIRIQKKAEIAIDRPQNRSQSRKCRAQGRND